MNQYKRIIEEAGKTNLCTYFVLPLCLVNKLRFGGKENFLNSYLSPDGKYIYVEIVSDLFLLGIDDLPEYKLIEFRDSYFVEFKIPEQWSKDVQLFMKGQYTKLSEGAKRRIREGSSLKYREYVGTVMSTDFRLMALANSDTIRSMWEELIFDDNELGRMSIGEELLSIPDESSYITIPK